MLHDVLILGLEWLVLLARKSEILWLQETLHDQMHHFLWEEEEATFEIFTTNTILIKERLLFLIVLIIKKV